MPTYEYACPTCGIVDVYQSIKAEALTKCPQCKKAKVTRMVSRGAAVIFKGSGFWETDYNRSTDYQKKQAEEKSGTAKAPTAPAGADAKSDAQPPEAKTQPQAKAEPKAKTGTQAKPEPKAAAPASPTAPPKTKPTKP